MKISLNDFRLGGWTDRYASLPTVPASYVFGRRLSAPQNTLLMAGRVPQRRIETQS